MYFVLVVDKVTVYNVNFQFTSALARVNTKLVDDHHLSSHLYSLNQHSWEHTYDLYPLAQRLSQHLWFSTSTI